MLSIAYATSITNREEYEGDKLLTKEQNAEYQHLLDQGTKYFDEGKYAEAETEFKKILEFAPKKNLAYFNLGLVKYRQGDYQAALEYFNTVIKKHSYYVGAAFYYKSICHLVLNQTAEAKEASKHVTPARFFRGQLQNLMQAIQTGSDVYYANAEAALADKNYELCLLELEDSVLTDTEKGKDLANRCRAAIEGESNKVVLVKSPIESRYEVYFNARLMHSDNIFGEANNVVGKYLYSFNLGGEYVFKDVVDYGIRASYYHANAVDQGNFKDEFINVGVPFYYSKGNDRYSANIYYDHAKANGRDAFAGLGLLVNYFHNEGPYTFGFIGSASNKNSLSNNFDYRTGYYSVARLLATKRIDELTLNAYVGYDQNLAGDEPIAGSRYLPYGHKATRYGIGSLYDLNKESKVVFRANFANRDYTNKAPDSSINRKDGEANFTLAYEYMFNKNVTGFVQQSYTKNDSNYDNSQSVNKNYIENMTTLGVSLVKF